MEIDLKEFKVDDVFKNFTDDGDNGVFALNGNLIIRPPYQREFIYNIDQQKAVMDTVIKHFPLNSMYWVKREDGKYEVLDGQQRILSIMYYLSHKFSITVNNSEFYCDSLTDDLYNKILDYDLHVYICTGEDSEKLEWFKTINIAGEKLKDQEIRNAIYTGPWLSDAKAYFSKRNCPGVGLSNKYIKAEADRQELLEKALKWICETKNMSIREYMSLHQHDDDANELWQYFQDIIAWVKKIFPDYFADMKGLDWGKFYNKYHNNQYNSSKLSSEAKILRADDEVTNKRGIYEYLLSKDYEPFAERKLSLRDFDDKDKKRKYEEQNGICPICHKHFEYEEMQGDHKLPWSRGGKTEYNNLQMLCEHCNKTKSDS